MTKSQRFGSNRDAKGDAMLAVVMDIPGVSGIDENRGSRHFNCVAAIRLRLLQADSCPALPARDESRMLAAVSKFP
jgi:hypothetical protein